MRNYKLVEARCVVELVTNMNRLILITLAIFAASAALAANYYLPPLRSNPTSTTRIPAYFNSSGVRALGWDDVLQRASAYAHLSTSRRIGSANQIFDLMTTANAKKLTIRAAAGAGAYVRKFEIKNGSGQIVSWVNASGQMIFGTPQPLSITSVYPPNGATNVSNGVWADYSSSGGGRMRINTTAPAVTYNKSTDVTGSLQYIVGLGNQPTNTGVTSIFYNFSGTPGTTYTIRVVRGSIEQTDGETSSSCGSAMTDMGSYCQSTFTMK